MLGLGRDRVGLKGLLLLYGDRQIAQLHAGVVPLSGVLCVRLGLLHRRLGEVHGDPEVGRVDHHQEIALVHELIVDTGSSTMRPATSGAIVTT